MQTVPQHSIKWGGRKPPSLPQSTPMKMSVNSRHFTIYNLVKSGQKLIPEKCPD